MKLIVCHKMRILVVLSAVAMLLSACTHDDASSAADTPNAPSEIHMNANVWQVMEGTRATVINPGAVSGSFKVYAYYNTTTENYIDGEIVNYDEGVSAWVNPQFWPKDKRSLDFFAYMPTSLTNTSCTFDATAYDADTNPDGYSAGNPRVVCTSLPMTYDKANPTAGQGSNLQELVYAVTTGQSEASNGADGVTLTFKRPFARIIIQLSSTQEDIHINSITFKGIKNNGSCSFNGTASTWTLSGDAANFVATLNDDFQASDNIGTFIMIPQTWAGEIEVDISWNNWGETEDATLTATVPTNWEAGHSYTYTFNVSKYALTVNIAKFTEQW